MGSLSESLKASNGLTVGVITDRTLASLRVLLSISAVLILYIDPNEPSRLGRLTYFALILYVLYAITVYLITRSIGRLSWRVFQYLIWADVLLYSVFVSFNTGTNAVFFFFYLYAIIAGSSRGGTRIGFALTAASVLLFVTINLALVSDLHLDVARFLRRTVYMGVLGCILAYWGGAESVFKKKLTFLKDLSSMANPRFGVDHTIKRMLHAFLNFYRADYCLFIVRASEVDLELYRAARENAEVDQEPMRVREWADIPILSASETHTAVFDARATAVSSAAKYMLYDSEHEITVCLPPEQGWDVAEFLNVRSFITTPLRYRGRIRGRVLVACTESRRLNIEDAMFLQQAVDQIVPIIENIRLVDHMASDAAKDERRKLARSIHDRVIQPYLGLQIGLKALHQEFLQPLSVPDSNGSRARSVSLLEQLIGMTRDGIEELRQYVHGLKQSNASDTPLAESIRSFAERFENATGVHVVVNDGACGLTMEDRLSVEIFQMTAEALSNVHRHTKSRIAQVSLRLVNSNFLLVVENEEAEDLPARQFRPRSISERADAIGARTDVLCSTGRTLVTVEVPL